MDYCYDIGMVFIVFFIAGLYYLPIIDKLCWRYIGRRRAVKRLYKAIKSI